MPNCVDVTYAQTGNSLNTDALGSRYSKSRDESLREAVDRPPKSGTDAPN